jgi:hypothetical protein
MITAARLVESGRVLERISKEFLLRVLMRCGSMLDVRSANTIKRNTRKLKDAEEKICSRRAVASTREAAITRPMSFTD